MDIQNIFQRVNKAPPDPKTGIRLTRITGDENYSFFAAEIDPGTKLRPHYHRHGIELYQILEGTGIMKTGKKTGTGLAWDEKFMVQKGDCFTIGEGMVHQIANHGPGRLVAAFVCPPAHVEDDRFFVE